MCGWRRCGCGEGADQAGLCHTFGGWLAGDMLESGNDIRVIGESLGHKEVGPTMVCGLGLSKSGRAWAAWAIRSESRMGPIRLEASHLSFGKSLPYNPLKNSRLS